MAVTIAWDKAKSLTRDIFIRTGFRPDYAETVSDNLTLAEARGIYSHGLVQVKPYVNQFRNQDPEGRVIRNTSPEVIREHPSAALVDAHFCPGAVAGNFAMDIAVQKAKIGGIGMTTVKNGTHFGMAYYYAKRAVSEGLIGMAFTNAGLLVAPYGGKEKVLGTNPICIAVPSAGNRPVVFDAATSVQAFNKIFAAWVEGRKIPLGWAQDAEGRPTDDPGRVFDGSHVVGSLLPFGGYKGYGLGFMVNVLTGFLSGASLDRDEEGRIREDTDNVGYCFCAVDPGAFVDPAEFREGIRLFGERVKHSACIEGTEEILLPGEIEFRNEEKAAHDGLNLADGVYRSLSVLAQGYNIPLPYENRCSTWDGSDIPFMEHSDVLTQILPAGDDLCQP